MYYLLFKSLHLVAMVAWFAGLFYLIRLFVYHTEAFEKNAEERNILLAQYTIMESRLYKIICMPAMVLTWAFGLSLIHMNGMAWLMENPWIQIKLILILLLSIYQLYSKRIMGHLQNNSSNLSSFQLRLFNEVPTLLLLSIILLAVYKNLLNFGYAFGGILAFAILLYAVAKIYKSIRKES